MVQPLLEPLPYLRQVGRAHNPPEIAGRDHALTPQNTDAEGEAVVLAAELIHPILGHRHLTLAHLNANVGVATVTLATAIGGDQVEHGVAHLRDRIDTYSLGHVYPSEAIDGD